MSIFPLIHPTAIFLWYLSITVRESWRYLSLPLDRRYSASPWARRLYLGDNIFNLGAALRRWLHFSNSVKLRADVYVGAGKQLASLYCYQTNTRSIYSIQYRKRLKIRSENNESRGAWIDNKKNAMAEFQEITTSSVVRYVNSLFDILNDKIRSISSGSKRWRNYGKYTVIYIQLYHNISCQTGSPAAVGYIKPCSGNNKKKKKVSHLSGTISSTRLCQFFLNLEFITT